MDYPDLVWEIIWINLSHNSFIINWFNCNISANSSFMIALTLDAVMHPLEFLLFQCYELSKVPVLVFGQQTFIGMYGVSLFHTSLYFTGLTISPFLSRNSTETMFSGYNAQKVAWILLFRL